MALLVKARTCSIALERRQRASVITPRRLNDPLPGLSLTVLMSVVCAAYFPPTYNDGYRLLFAEAPNVA